MTKEFPATINWIGLREDGNKEYGWLAPMPLDDIEASLFKATHDLPLSELELKVRFSDTTGYLVNYRKSGPVWVQVSETAHRPDWLVLVLASVAAILAFFLFAT